jgi:hypothetical protein
MVHLLEMRRDERGHSAGVIKVRSKKEEVRRAEI